MRVSFVGENWKIKMCKKLSELKPDKTGTTYCPDRKKWKAQISIDGKTKFIGRFDTQKEAHAAYKKVKCTKN
jgi:hypothetical protein